MTIKTYCVVAMSIFIILLLGSVIVGIIGAVKYVSEKHAESVYKPTMCLVKNYQVNRKTCTTQDCNGRSCTTRTYSCDEEFYTVRYIVSNGQTIETTFEASDGPGSNSVSTLLEPETMS